MTTVTVPTIDVAAWCVGTQEQRTDIQHEVDEGLRSSGFLLAVNHGIPDEPAAAVRRLARRFFALPTGTKDRYRSRVGGRGWIPPGAEANSYASGVVAPPDLKETFKIGHDGPGAAANVWPAEVPELRTHLVDHFASTWELALDLFELFALALGLPGDAFLRHASPGASSLNVNWYPSLRATEAPRPGQYRIAAHSDFGVLTILDRQVGYGGLQIQAHDGTWVDAPHRPGALTINVGDMLARWTGDRWRSTVHRVLPPSTLDGDEELLSLVAFCGVDPSTVVETLTVDAPQRYEPIRAGDYMRSKLEAIDVM